MADVHLFQWVLAFGAALWITGRWMLRKPVNRWRHIIVGFFATLLWIPTAYTANNVYVADAGATVRFGSQALAGFATLMVVVCIAAGLVELYLWGEAVADEASQQLPAGMRHGDPRQGDD